MDRTGASGASNDSSTLSRGTQSFDIMIGSWRGRIVD
jgi:hypothetical protein